MFKTGDSFEPLSQIDCKGVFQDSTWIARSDGKWYQDAAALFGLVGAVSFPFFWPLGLFLAGVAALVNGYFRAGCKIYALAGRVVNRTAWRNDKGSEFYYFTIEVVEAFSLNKKGLNIKPKKAIIKEVRVSKVIYNSFELSQQVFFVFSGFGDLIGFYLHGFISLSKTITNSEGLKTRFSVSIPQKYLNKPKDWEKINPPQ